MYVVSLSVGSASSDRSFTILLHLGGCLLVRVVWCVVRVMSIYPTCLLSCDEIRVSVRSIFFLFHCQLSANSEIAESMLILESLSITHQRLRVSLSVSLSVSLPVLVFLSLGICCVRILCRLSVVFGNLDERSERDKI